MQLLCKELWQFHWFLKLHETFIGSQKKPSHFYPNFKVLNGWIISNYNVLIHANHVHMSQTQKNSSSRTKLWMQWLNLMKFMVPFLVFTWYDLLRTYLLILLAKWIFFNLYSFYWYYFTFCFLNKLKKCHNWHIVVLKSWFGSAVSSF